jgi:hypothetical protein
MSIRSCLFRIFFSRYGTSGISSESDDFVSGGLSVSNEFILKIFIFYREKKIPDLSFISIGRPKEWYSDITAETTVT